MRIYLLNPPFLPRFVRCGRWQGVVARSRTLYYPLWLAYAAGLLEEKSNDVRLVDAPAWGWDRADVMRDVEIFQPDLIVVDSNFSSLSNDLHVAQLLKEKVSQAKTVLVGPPASQFADQILANEGIDAVARFEFDFTLADIAQAIEEGKHFDNIKGISYNRNGKVVHNPDREFTTAEDLDRIPFVSKVYQKHLNVRDYHLGHTLYPMVQIFTGRGCPNRCTFCSWPETLTGRKYRVRSIKNVVDEFEYIKRELPEVKEIFIEDDTFTIDGKRLKAFCEEIKSRGLKVSWSCNARANLDYETMKIMKEAGCRLLDVGYESGSVEILENIEKGITTEQMREFARSAKKAGLMVLGDFVFGFPGETKESAERTIEFAKELRPNHVQFAVATPIPGTRFYQWAKENNFLLTEQLEESLDKDGFQRCIISYPGFTNQDIEEYVDRALRGYYLSASYVPMALRNILRRNGLHELKTMLSSARVFLKYLRRKNAPQNRVSEKGEGKRWDEFWHRGELWLTLLRFTPTYRKIVRIFNQMTLARGAKILDVGCGSGKLASFWSQNGHDIFGLDISDQALEFTRSQGVPVMKADVRRLPFNDGTFDLVYSDGLLEHFPDPEFILAELFRVSRNYVFTLVPRTTIFNKLLVAAFKIPKQYDRESHEWINLHRRFAPQSIEYSKAFTMFAIVCKK